MGDPIPFSLDGEKLEGQAGDTLAGALLRAGVTTFTRSIKYHRPRGPFCFSGSCGQCLVRVDGVPSLPACRVSLSSGMACERQNGPLGSVEQDLFRAVDFLYPGGLDHHHLMIQSRLLGRVALEVARRLAGLGTLPAKTLVAQEGSAREVPLVIVGGGPAGLAAARGAVEAGISGITPLLLERDSSMGGAARFGLDPQIGSQQIEAWQQALGDRVERLNGAELIGLYADPQPNGDALLAVRLGSKLLAVRARRVVIATGGISQPLPFPGNDRPGVYAARGLLALHEQTGVRCIETTNTKSALAVAGAGDELFRCTRALIARGYSVGTMVVLDNYSAPTSEEMPSGVQLLHGEIVRARGNPVAEIQVKISERAPKSEGKPGSTKKIPCGAIAIALPPAPSHDLASSTGAKAELSPDQNGFPLIIDSSGRTSIRWIFACGTAAGSSLLFATETARALARRSGEAAAREASAQ